MPTHKAILSINRSQAPPEKIMALSLKVFDGSMITVGIKASDLGLAFGSSNPVPCTVEILSPKTNPYTIESIRERIDIVATNNFQMKELLIQVMKEREGF